LPFLFSLYLQVFNGMKNINTDDTELVSLLNEGNRKAFNGLFHKYYKPLVAYAYRLVELQDAEEIVQDLFVWIWEKRKQLQISSSLNNYMFKAVHLRCLSCIQSKQMKRRKESFFWQMQDIYAETPLDYFEVQELVAKIDDALQRLPKDYKDAFMMQRFHGMSYKEIAHEFSVSTKTVDYRIQKATKLLSKDLGDYFPLFLFVTTYST